MDREAKDQYLLVIQAKDMVGQNGGLSGTTSVTVTLTDVNDNPPRFPRRKLFNVITACEKHLYNSFQILLFFLIYSSLIYCIQAQFCLLPLLLVCPLPPPLSSRSIPPPFPWRKRRPSKGYQSSMACEVTIRLGTNPHIKAEQGNPVVGKESQE